MRKTTHAMLYQPCWNNIAYGYLLVNAIQIFLRQHCTRKLLAQCLPRAHRILSQENRLFKICLAACFLTGYDITEQSWVFLFNARLGFIYGLRDNNEMVDSYMTSTIFSVP